MTSGDPQIRHFGQQHSPLMFEAVGWCCSAPLQNWPAMRERQQHENTPVTNNKQNMKTAHKPDWGIHA